VSRTRLTFLLLALVLLPNLLFCQRNEVSFSVGEIFTSDQTTAPVPGLPCALGSVVCNIANFKTDPGIALEGAYAHRVLGGVGLPSTLSFRLWVCREEGVAGFFRSSSIMNVSRR
jgi:hypothetical protein